MTGNHLSYPLNSVLTRTSYRTKHYQIQAVGLILQPHFERARNQRILVRHFFAEQLAAHAECSFKIVMQEMRSFSFALCPFL